MIALEGYSFHQLCAFKTCQRLQKIVTHLAFIRISLRRSDLFIKFAFCHHILNRLIRGPDNDGLRHALVNLVLEIRRIQLKRRSGTFSVYGFYILADVQ